MYSLFPITLDPKGEEVPRDKLEEDRVLPR